MVFVTFFGGEDAAPFRQSETPFGVVNSNGLQVPWLDENPKGWFWLVIAGPKHAWQLGYE